jgi:HK97 family phage major capsid protein
VLSTGSGNQINYPTTDATSEEGEIVGENATVTTDDTITFGSVNINAYMYSSKAVAVPFQLLQDSMIDMEALVINRLGTRLGRITNKHYTTGTGNNQPRGIVTAAKLGVTAVSGQTDSIVYDDLVDMEHSVDPAYRVGGCSWMFNDAALKSLKKLKDGEGRPLWLPGLTTKEPDTILSYPYTINQHMAVPAASAKSMLFGNFSYYMVRDVMQVLLFRMTDSVFTLSGQVGFVAFFRTDGNLIAANNDAVRYFIQAAS